MTDEPNQTAESAPEPLRSRSDEDIAEFLAGWVRTGQVSTEPRIVAAETGARK